MLTALIVLTYVVVTILSMRQTSATFDEILLPAAGARGYATADFDLVRLYHPRLMPYLYGLPVALSAPQFPVESAVWQERGGAFGYAQELFFRQGNDTAALVFRSRLIAVAVGAALILLVFTFVRRSFGDTAAVLAAGMTAFLPDLIAHGGISYNDVPAALVMFGGVWALDRAAASPTHRSVMTAALLVAVALTVKYSAIALVPIGGALIALEAGTRGREWRAYLAGVLRLVPLAVVSVYVVLVLLYLGDVMLTSFFDGLVFNIRHADEGHANAPAWLLGRSSPDGFWYFFPVAFFIKTPAAFHLTLLVASVGLWTLRHRVSAFPRSPLRGPAIAILVFGYLLLSAKLNIGFRHALPILPFVVVIAAAGLSRVWQLRGPRVRAGIVALVLVQAASVLSWYPHFIPYTSEYFRDRDRGHMRLTDSSHDWGQGLTLLRRFMEEENVSAVHLSYFGSAVPEAYGIAYLPLPSFFELVPVHAVAEAPRFTAVSATNLVGGYVGDAFGNLRQREPYRVLGHTVFIYETND